MNSQKIPKKIHYCWFGGNPLPPDAVRCIESWKKFCPDYEIIEWNETNFDVTENQYCNEAYLAQKWAFVSDFARLKIIFEHGGIYLDTDVEMIRSVVPLLSSDQGFIGFQNEEEINTGLGFSAQPHNSCVQKMLEFYEARSFYKKDGTFDLTPCPVTNTVALKCCGLITGAKSSSKIQKLDGLTVYPISYFNPLDRNTLKLNLTQDSYTIHHYAASWLDSKIRKKAIVKKYIPHFFLKIRERLISKKNIYQFEKHIGL